MSSHANAVIIGAGIAGLATAIRLSLQDFHVTVFEKNNHPGGKIAELNVDGYHFDKGPSLFTQPINVEELFTLANEPIEEYFSYQKLPVTCKYFYEDGSIIKAYTNASAFAQELQKVVGEDAGKVESYLNQSRNIYHKIGNVFLDHSLHKSSTLFNSPVLKAFAATRFKYVFSSLHKLNSKHFSKPNTVQLFDRFATYNGSNPYNAPGMLSIISHLEINEGVYYPSGGMINIADALYKLALKLGVRFNFDCTVQRIIRSEGKVKGIVVNNENVYANIVVTNTDVYHTYKSLLNDPIRASKILKRERSSSAVIFYWGINKSFPELDLHNVFFSQNYKEEFDSIFTRKICSNDPTVYINVTSKLDASHAPAGKENWFVMVNAPANYGQNWNQLKQYSRQTIINKLNKMLQVNLEDLIEVEESLDPLKIEAETGSFMGSLYGASSNSRMAAFRRHPNFSSAINGLYFVGGTVHPGGGIPLCLKSAKIACELIKQDSKKLLQHH
ncbi:MAG: crtI [Segetibacter sp.]|nr:crtI [Segetibacter sp.]